jgi:hypothetical protein
VFMLQHENSTVESRTPVPARHWARRVIAAVAITAVSVGVGPTIFKGLRSEAFAKWNYGPVLTVTANTPSTVVAHREVHTNISPVFDHPISELEIIQSVSTTKGPQIHEGWIHVSPNTYSDVQDGASVSVQQIRPDWTNELLTNEMYDLTEDK